MPERSGRPWLKLICVTVFLVLVAGSATVVLFLPATVQQPVQRTPTEIVSGKSRVQPARPENSIVDEQPAVAKPPKPVVDQTTARQVRESENERNRDRDVGITGQENQSTEFSNSAIPEPPLPTPPITRQDGPPGPSVSIAPKTGASEPLPREGSRNRSASPAEGGGLGSPEYVNPSDVDPDRGNSGDGGSDVQSKTTSELLLDKMLRLQARLENDGIRTWGTANHGLSYPEALAKIDDANAAYDKAAYADAVERIRSAISSLNELDASKPERFRAALEAGRDALQRRDTSDANKEFLIALAIEPQNAEAKQGLERARNLKRVIALSEEGASLAANGKHEAAEHVYRQALEIDPQFSDALAGHANSKAMVADRNFRHALTVALQALDRGDFVAGEHALKKADRLRPNAVETDDVRRKLANAKKLAALGKLHNDARKYEREEQWEKAAQAYKEALKIDARASFALRGEKNAQEYRKLYRMIDFYLSQSNRLQSAAPRSHATKIMATANAIKQPGPVLARKREQLANLLDAFERPVAVTLRSDGKTDVTLYRIGRFEAFVEQRLKLRPGKYVAVGARSGFRDVRIEFLVPVGGGDVVVDVRCEEPI